MAELTRIEINEKTESEIEPSEETTQDVPEGEAEEANPSTEAPEGDQERPEWLPEKFKSAEDMANAYSELEKKIGRGEEGETPESVVESTEASDIVTEASVEFFEKGELTEDSYESLAKLGLSKELVDSFAEGQAALQENQSNVIRSAADGNYDAMTEWAGENLSDEELAAFNESVASGTIDQAKFAVKGLHARWRSEEGSTAPRLVKGETTGSGSLPYQSMQEVRRAMQDPLYKAGDKAYHQMVDRRLAVSSF